MIDAPMIDAAFAGAWAIPAELHLGLDPPVCAACLIGSEVQGGMNVYERSVDGANDALARWEKLGGDPRSGARRRLVCGRPGLG